MSHDYAHCDNEQCLKKDTCKRYLGRLQLKEMNYEYPISYSIVENVDECGEYWNNQLTKTTER